MVNTPAMPRGQKQSIPRIVEGKVEQALLQADTHHSTPFLKVLNDVAAILAENPACFQKQRTAFAAVTRYVQLGSFAPRFFALYLHSLFVGNKFHQLTDARQKLEAELDAEINPIRREELERELDKYIPPIEKRSLNIRKPTTSPHKNHIPPIEKQNLNFSDLEKFASSSPKDPKRSNRDRTRRLRFVSWHLPMTEADYQAGLGLSRKSVCGLMGRLDPKAKCLPQSRRNEKTRYPPETNWRVLRQFLLQTKRSSDWKRDFHLGLLDYYRNRRCYTQHNEAQILKAFEGIKASVDYSSPASPAPAADTFTAAIQCKF